MVSVIIPVYNGEKYISTILQCFQKQIYTDFELIFINDGSNDNSLAELKKIKNSSELKIQVIDQVNGGVCKARNRGIETAKGEILCFCDVDDEVVENYISDMISVIENYKVDLVICKSQLQRMGDKEGSISLKSNTVNVTIKNTIYCLRDFLYGRMVSSRGTLMVIKSVIFNHKLRFAEGYNYSEDLDFCFRIIGSSNKIGYLNKRLYVYKLQENSATSRFNNERLHGYILFKELEIFFEKNNPLFACEFKKFGAAKIMWSIAWQAAIHYDKGKFKEFILQNNVRNEIKKLILFKNYKVFLSASAFLVSPLIFRFLAIKFGKKYIH